MFSLIGILALSYVISRAMAVKVDGPTRYGLDDVEAPTADLGGKIYVLFGTRELGSPNVVWYGDFKTKAVKKSTGKK